MPRSKHRDSKDRARQPRRERSAGVLVFHDDGGETGAKRLFLLLDYGRHWDYPKGHLEADEDDRSAALRELREETGIEAELIPGFSHEIGYTFRSSSKGLVHKNVIFFLARALSTDVHLSDEHVAYDWLDRDAALRRLTFENARQVLSAAAEFLDAKLPLRGETP